MFKNYVIKVANFNHCHLHFLQGCYANWSERQYYKRANKINKDRVAPSYFCSWFGLFQIQARCLEKLENLIEQEIEDYKDLHCGDYKKENFGWYNQRLVCLDYP